MNHERPKSGPLTTAPQSTRLAHNPLAHTPLNRILLLSLVLIPLLAFACTNTESIESDSAQQSVTTDSTDPTKNDSPNLKTNDPPNLEIVEETEREIIQLLKDGHVMYRRTELFNKLISPEPECIYLQDARPSRDCDGYPERIVLESWESTDESGIITIVFRQESNTDGRLLANATGNEWTQFNGTEKWSDNIVGTNLFEIVENMSVTLERVYERNQNLEDGEILGKPSVVVPASVADPTSVADPEAVFEYQLENPLITRTTRWQEDENGERYILSESKVVDFQMLPPGLFPYMRTRNLSNSSNMRNAYVARNQLHALDSFIISHPLGWDEGESWPWNGPQGWLSAPRPNGEEDVPILRWQIGNHDEVLLKTLANDERYETTKYSIRGTVATLVMPAANHATEQNLDRIGIYYETMPGLPANSDPVPLSITGSSKGFNLEVLTEVLTTVRYYELPWLPKTPLIHVFPADDWERVDARDDIEDGFSVNLPPNWQVEQGISYDSLWGKFTGDGIELAYELGIVIDPPYNPEQFITDSERPTYHRIWEEEIDDATFWFVQPVSKSTDPEAITAVLTTASGTIIRASTGLNIYSIGLTPEQQDLALAIFRTIQFD